MKQPYISRIQIKNFRNFESVDFSLSEQQIIIGENNVGKSNLLRALQLILDPSFSDDDRLLSESDFYEGLEDPINNNEEIIISIFIDNYAHNKNILSLLSDATVSFAENKLLKLTYKFFSDNAENKDISNYEYKIYKGDNEDCSFTHIDRRFLNLKVVKGIRDVESEMRNPRQSPLTKLIKQKYNIKKEDVETITKKINTAGAETIDLPELNDLQKKINKIFNEIIAHPKNNFDISLQTIDLDANRILNTLKPLLNSRDTANNSLGINNILYIALMLLLISDDTIKTYLPSELYEKLHSVDKGEILEKYYERSGDGFTLKKNSLGVEEENELYDFMHENNLSNAGVTILAIEEPEAHIHPIYQRLLYKYIIASTNASVMITTHSTDISSAAPINSIIHLIHKKNKTQVHSTANLEIKPKEALDLMRYIDVKRGEIYLAKAVIFVEGIADEYLVPAFASALGYDLDRYGIVICNINCTNFIPYRKFASSLGIPSCIITDGDYYHTVNGEKIFGDVYDKEKHDDIGFAGNERGIAIIETECTPDKVARLKKLNFKHQDNVLQKLNIFIGVHTLEIDILAQCCDDDKEIISDVFEELTDGGKTQLTNFKNNIKNNKYKKCLAQIEARNSMIGKGRFAQRFSSSVTRTMIPDYIKKAILSIIQQLG